MLGLALALVVVGLQATDQPAAGETLAIKAGRIITVSGADIKDGIVLIRNGRIANVGTDIGIPDKTLVVDAAGQTVMPGIVDANSGLGVQGSANEESGEIDPHARILDSINPRHGSFQRAAHAGITTAYVGPGNHSVIGGLGSVVKTHGRSLAEMLVQDEVALKAAMGSAPSYGNFPPRGAPPSTFFARRPTTRMGVVWEFRKSFFDARAYREEAPARKDAGREVLLRALDRKLAVRVAASRAGDIETAARLAEEFGLAIMIEEAQEAYRHAELLAKRDIPVLLRPNYQTASIYAAEGSEIRFTTFTTLLAAGVRTALLSAGLDEGESHLAMAAYAVKYGATPGQALRAVTLTPAELLGVAERVGSIEEGKDADLLFLSGDPLDATARIERVMIGGKVAAGKKLTEH